MNEREAQSVGANIGSANGLRPFRTVNGMAMQLFYVGN
jgi:hypothetical protein